MANWAGQQVHNIANSFNPTTYNPQSSSSSVGGIAKPNPNIPDWVWNQVVQGAQDAAQKYGIPASVTIAQFLQETGGNPNHFIGGTNVFGIKGSGDAGSVTIPTTEYDAYGRPHMVNANFAKYSSIPASMDAHAKLLSQNPAYSKLQQLAEKGDFDPQSWTKGLQGTYATDPNYASNLNNLIAKYGLNHADNYNKYPVSETMLNDKLGR